jgi:tRNA(Ile)-lysidine synthase
MNLNRETFKEQLIDDKLIKKEDLILIAFSGGKDSTALLHLLLSLKKDLRFTCKALYFNHQLRIDSSVEAEWVRKVCLKNNIELISESRDVKKYSKDSRSNVEEAASILRYNFFGLIASRYRGAKIATAHTRSDQAETFFIKLFRGSGTEGLSSIFKIKNSNIIRPLLNFSQKDILNYLTLNKIEYYFDSSNNNKSFCRNRIRLDLLPRIKEISPVIELHISHLTDILHQELDFFRSAAKDFLNKKMLLNSILPLNSFKELHPALKRHILREYIRIIKGNLLNINFDHLDNMLRYIKNSKNISLPGLDLIIKKGFLFPAKLKIKKLNYSLLLNDCPLTLNIPEINCSLSMEVCTNYSPPQTNFSIILPLKELKFPLILRSPLKTDKYLKINASFDQYVFEMIRENGSPHEFRGLYPVLLDSQGKIIWCLSSPLADKFKVTKPLTGDFLKISVDCPQTGFL